MRPIAAPAPGLLIPGAEGDVALGKVRRQVEVPASSLLAPLEALLGAVDVTTAAGQQHRAQLIGAVVKRLSAARVELAAALTALDELEASG